MLDIKEHCDDTLPTELCGIKFRKGWYYLVDKKILEPYICEDEKDTDYKSIVIYLDCEELRTIGDVIYEAIFFTDIKHVGISGRICAVRNDRGARCHISCSLCSVHRRHCSESCCGCVRFCEADDEVASSSAPLRRTGV